MLIELLVVLIGIGLFTSVCLPAHVFSKEAFYSFSDAYLLSQSQAIAASERVEFEDMEGRRIDFNADGNVSHAQTIHFANTEQVIIVELGGGRLVVR